MTYYGVVSRLHLTPINVKNLATEATVIIPVCTLPLERSQPRVPRGRRQSTGAVNPHGLCSHSYVSFCVTDRFKRLAADGVEFDPNRV
jgi:hypothetical protein